MAEEAKDKLDKIVNPPKEIADMTFSMKDSGVELDKSHENIIVVDNRTGKITPAKTVEKSKEEIEEELQNKKLAETKGKEKDKEDKSEETVSKGTNKSSEDIGKGSDKTGKEVSPGILRPPSDKAVKGKEEVKIEIKPFTPGEKKLKVERDYTGYSPEEVAYFKQMSDEAYKYTSGLIKQNKDLSGKATGMYFQHPDAYTLTPEYKKNREEHLGVARSAEVWTALLEQVKAGNKIREPKGFNEKGELVFSDRVLEPTGPLEEELRGLVAASKQEMTRKDTEMLSLKNGFNTQYTSDEGRIQAERKARFMWANDPKFLDYVVSTEGGGEKSIKQIKEEFKSIFPSYRQNDSIVEVASDLMAVIVYQHAELQEALKGKQTVEKKLEDDVRLEPNPDGRELIDDKGKAVGGVKTFTMEGGPLG